MLKSVIIRGSGLGARLLALALPLSIAPSARAATCENLASLSLPDTTISIAQAVPAGSFTTPYNAPLINLPAFCRVAATLKPSRKLCDSLSGIVSAPFASRTRA